MAGSGNQSQSGFRKIFSTVALVSSVRNSTIEYIFSGKEYSEIALVCQRKRVAICGVFGVEISH